MKRILKRICNRLGSLLARHSGPRMLYGFRRSDGIFLPLFRRGSTTFIDHPESFFPSDNVYVGHHNYLEASSGLHIGEFSQITSFISITTHSSHDAIRLYGRHYGGNDMKAYHRAPVYVGSFCFIGPHVVIMPGTKIGKGCLVKAYSYLDGEFPDFSIIGGNPAKVLGSTIDRDDIFLLQNPELRLFYEEWAANNLQH
ncbi:MAG: acyltransferase [Bacteroidales bacterium]|nr:acyltransferase [Bacteroidales bacterium]